MENKNNKIIYHKFEQRTPEWYSARSGKITCSVLDKILTPAKLELSKQSVKYAFAIAAERARGKPEETPVTFEMERGSALEESARIAYEEYYDMPVETFGFIENTELKCAFGFSPDGIIDGRTGGIEIKCPNAANVMETLLDGAIDGGYMLQMQGGMLAADLEYMDFVPYCEGLKLRPVRVRRDEKIIAAIRSAVEQFDGLIAGLVEQYQAINAPIIPMPEEIE